MKYVWGTRSRSGSQFLLELTLKLLGSRAWPQARIAGSRRDGLDPSRVPSFIDLFAQGEGIEYFRVHDIQAVKLEDPCNDDFGDELADAFPNAKWMTSHRSIEAIVTSHFNIKKWGHGEEYVLGSFRRSIDLFERLAEQGRLFVVNVDAPEAFDLQRLSTYLDVPITSTAREIAGNWRPVNDLRYQKAKWDEAFHGMAERPPGLDDLRQRHPWIDEVEARYEAVWRETSLA